MQKCMKIETASSPVVMRCPVMMRFLEYNRFITDRAHQRQIVVGGLH